MLTVPAFEEPRFFENRVNEKTRTWVMEDVEASLFDDYCALLEKEGYIQKEAYEHSARRYAAFLSEDGEGVFLNFYRGNCELTLVREENTAYFSYTDTPRSCPASPSRITQVTLKDFGMSYVIRLSDGRFIILDGGRHYECDQDQLFQCLKTESPDDEKPVIAAWILTHPHSDHYLCFLGFMERYGEEVVIEKLLFNFPEHDDFEHYPKLKTPESMAKGLAAFLNVPKLWAWVEKLGVPLYIPRTGQRYQIGNAACEILACMDETMHESKKINASSLVIRMELEGQVILWATDASFGFARMPQRYGSYLKSDILQIPHHGFQSGDPSAEIAGYDLIQPKVCFLPVSDANAYIHIDIYKESTRYIMRSSYVEEIITGTRQRTITLPYTAPAYAKRELEERVWMGRESGGARVWIFSGLSTSNPEDFVFTILNVTGYPAEVSVDLYFEERLQNVRNIKADVTERTVKDIFVLGEKSPEEWLKAKEIPENSRFAVRFTCLTPIVVTHNTRTASYHSVLPG